MSNRCRFGGFHEMTYGERFVKCAKCFLVALWHTGTMLDGSVGQPHYTICKFQTELVPSWPLDGDFIPCALLLDRNTFPPPLATLVV